MKKQVFNLSEIKGIFPLPLRERVRVRGKKSAFTLSEVLITLGIIGVVSAITMPTLIQKHEEQRSVAQLSKVYSTLSQAWQRMETEYGTIDTWGLTDTYTGNIDPETQKNIYDYTAQRLIAERLKKYLKVVKVCELGKICYPKARQYLNGNFGGEPKPLSTTNDSPPEAKFYLSDGTYIGFGWVDSGNNNLDIDVVLPGNKRILGRTEFFFKAYPNRIVPEGIKGEIGSISFESCNPELSTTSSGRGCTAWVLINRNMDYLHCRSELSWDGKTKCK